MIIDGNYRNLVCTRHLFRDQEKILPNKISHLTQVNPLNVPEIQCKIFSNFRLDGNEIKIASQVHKAWREVSRDLFVAKLQLNDIKSLMGLDIVNWLEIMQNRYGITLTINEFIKMCPNLKILDLSDSEFWQTEISNGELVNIEKLTLAYNTEEFKVLDFLNLFPNLKILNLNYCKVSSDELLLLSMSESKIEEVHLNSCNEIYNLILINFNSLKNVSLENCNNLIEINIKEASNIEKIKVTSCKSIRSFDLANNSSLKSIYIENCEFLKQINLIHISNLEKLNIKNCCALENLECLHSKLNQLSLTGPNALMNFDYGKISFLQKLILENTSNIKDLHLPASSSLKELRLTKFSMLKNLSFSEMSSLENLELDSNHQLVCLNFDGISKIRQLLIENCFSLTNLSLTNLKLLEEVQLVRNGYLKRPVFENLNHLKKIKMRVPFIKDEDLKAFHFEDLLSLEELDLSYSSLLVSPEFKELNKIKKLSLNQCSRLSNPIFEKLPSLEELQLNSNVGLKKLRFNNVPNLRILSVNESPSSLKIYRK